MLRRISCSVALLTLALFLTNAAAEEIKGTLVRVGDGKATVRLKAKEKGMKGEEKTYDLAKTVKVTLKEGKEGKEVADGLKSDLIAGLDPKKGRAATVVTNADNQVTEIILSVPKKKKDAK